MSFQLSLCAPVAVLTSFVPMLAGAQSRNIPSCTALPSSAKIALVLPGGGAKGYAHVGVIKILDSLGIVPDLVVGSSMGSIIGGVYASGYSGVEIEAMAKRFNIGPYIGRYSPRPPRVFAISGAVGASALQSQIPGEPSPIVLLTPGSGEMSIRPSLAQEGPINLLLTAMLLRGNVIARGNFDSLPTPFRAVATDVHSGERVVLDHGDLAQAVRSSVAIPFVFESASIDGREMVDGGLSENVPVKLARELGATQLILSTLDASGGRDSATRVAKTGTIDMMLKRIFVNVHPPLRESDIEISTDVAGVSNLDFSDDVVSLLTERGADAARKAVALACLPRRTRGVHEIPPMTGAIVTTDAAPDALKLLRSAVRPAPRRFLGLFKRRPAPFDSLKPNIDTVQAHLAHAGRSGVLQALWLNPQRTLGDSIAFDPIMQWASRRTLGLGAAFDNDLGGLAWASFADRRAVEHPMPLEVAGRITLGSRRQEGLVSFRRSVEDVRYSPSPMLVFMLGRENSALFAKGPGGISGQIDVAVFSEQMVQIGADLPIANNWTVLAGPLLRRWHGGLTDSSRTLLPVGFAVRVDHGDESRHAFARVDLEWNQRYTRASGRVTRRWNSSFANFTHSVYAGAVSGDAPSSYWFFLGGTDGFPGLNVAEPLGKVTASYQLETARSIVGPVKAVVDGTTGRVSRNPGGTVDGKWLFGTRVGIGADAPIGPVRLQYGLATNGRRQWFARVGRWI